MGGGGTVTFAVDGVIGLTNAIVVSNNTVLDATGHNVTISGSNAVSLFIVNPGVRLYLTNLTLADGLAQGILVGSNYTAALGGAICSTGMVVAVQCVFANNSAQGYVNGNPIYENPNIAQGGAIYNAGTLILSNSVFTANLAVGGSGETWPGLSVSPGQEGSGGAIYSTGSALIINCEMLGNVADGGQGGQQLDNGFNNPPASAGTNGGPANGGAICSTGSLIVSNTTFSGNAVVGGDGGIGGAGQSTVPGGFLTAQPGNPGSQGGNPGKGNGGGICCASNDSLVVNSTLFNNSATGGNGGNGGG